MYRAPWTDTPEKTRKAAGRALRFWRVNVLRMSLRKFACEAEVERTRVYAWERGEIGTKTISRIAKTCRVTPKVFMLVVQAFSEEKRCGRSKH